METLAPPLINILPRPWPSTLVYLIAEQAVISEQDGIFQKIVKRAGHNKQAGWNILEYLISEQAEFHRKKDIFN